MYLRIVVCFNNLMEYTGQLLQTTPANQVLIRRS